MPIVVACSCGKQLRVKDELAGKRIKCPACTAVVAIPLPARGAPAASRPAPAGAGNHPRPVSRRPDGEREPAAAYWADPHALGGKIFALGEEALLVADVGDEDDFKQVREALEGGSPVEEVLTKPDNVIPYEEMHKVESNLHHSFIDVTWQAPEDKETTETNLLCGSKEARDEMMAALERRLGWKRQVIEYSRLRASWQPLVVIGIFGFITVCMVLAALHPESDQGGTKVVRTNWIGAIFVWVFNIFGPVGVALLGTPFVLAGVIWLVMRMIRPPLMLTLAPRRRGERG
jgi:hypothetical protein